MIPVYQPYLNGHEKKYVNQCLDSTWISSQGEFIKRFEDCFSAYTNAKFASSVVNGTAALHTAIEVLELKAGDEVIVPTFTYIASVNAIIHGRVSPVFVDAIEKTCQMDPEEVKKKITSKTKAIMAVHLYGQPCDIEKLQVICENYNLYLIEDCAEALGARIKNQHVGTFGDIATFSFFGNKTITTGEGGMVISNNEQLIEKVNHFKNQGLCKKKEYWHTKLGCNYRMTNICSAIGLAQLEKIDEILSLKRNIFKNYYEALQGLPLKLHAEQQGMTHSFWMCSIILDHVKDRDLLRKYLLEHSIQTKPFFHPVHNMPHLLSKDSYPVTKSLSLRGINLPSYPGLTSDHLAKITRSIRNYFLAKEKAE